MKPVITTQGPRQRRGRSRFAATALAGLMVAMVTAGAALAAGPAGTVTETINVGVRSLTVSPTSATICSATSPLAFPNGTCQSPQITITNGPAGGHIDVNGANALPSDGIGNAWSLCGLAGPGGPPEPVCTGANGFPGPDQYIQETQNSSLLPSTLGVFLGNSPQCDLAVGGVQGAGENCVSSPGQVITENLGLSGPSASSDQSPTFSTSVTWTAAP